MRGFRLDVGTFGAFVSWKVLKESVLSCSVSSEGRGFPRNLAIAMRRYFISV